MYPAYAEYGLNRVVPRVFISDEMLVPKQSAQTALGRFLFSKPPLKGGGVCKADGGVVPQKAHPATAPFRGGIQRKNLIQEEKYVPYRNVQ